MITQRFTSLKEGWKNDGQPEQLVSTTGMKRWAHCWSHQALIRFLRLAWNIEFVIRGWAYIFPFKLLDKFSPSSSNSEHIELIYYMSFNYVLKFSYVLSYLLRDSDCMESGWVQRKWGESRKGFRQQTSGNVLWRTGSSHSLFSVFSSESGLGFFADFSPQTNSHKPKLMQTVLGEPLSLWLFDGANAEMCGW